MSFQTQGYFIHYLRQAVIPGLLEFAKVNKNYQGFKNSLASNYKTKLEVVVSPNMNQFYYASCH